jgi:hypothetical protein
LALQSVRPCGLKKVDRSLKFCLISKKGEDGLISSKGKGGKNENKSGYYFLHGCGHVFLLFGHNPGQRV